MSVRCCGERLIVAFSDEYRSLDRCSIDKPAIITTLDIIDSNRFASAEDIKWIFDHWKTKNMWLHDFNCFSVPLPIDLETLHLVRSIYPIDYVATFLKHTKTCTYVYSSVIGEEQDVFFADLVNAVLDNTSLERVEFWVQNATDMIRACAFHMLYHPKLKEVLIHQRDGCLFFPKKETIQTLKVVSSQVLSVMSCDCIPLDLRRAFVSYLLC